MEESGTSIEQLVEASGLEAKLVKSIVTGNYTSNADLKNAPFTSVFSPSCQSTLAVQISTYQNGGKLPAGQNGDCATQGAPGNLSQGIPVPAPPTPAQIANLASIPGLGFVAEATHFKSALIQQFNIQVEQQFGFSSDTLPSTVGQLWALAEGLLDKGPPTEPLSDDDPDLGGRSRVRDSDGNGSAVRDIGAYEYQRLAPTATFGEGDSNIILD